MAEKASVKVEVPYVFRTDNMCLIAGCKVGTEGQLLNIVQKFEEDEDKGKIMDMWNVYVLHLYLLTLLQVFCKWITGIEDDGVELSEDNEVPLHWLKENIEVEIVLRDKLVAKDRAEDDEGSDNEFVMQQRKKPL